MAGRSGGGTERGNGGGDVGSGPSSPGRGVPEERYLITRAAELVRNPNHERAAESTVDSAGPGLAEIVSQLVCFRGHQSASA